MRIDRGIVCKLLLITATLLLNACATTAVQPWERGRLARWDMQWQPDALEGAMAEHVSFSKEGTSGHLGAAGGGCGCN
jgi:outer membrane biogenesis lipoprotein LolB